MKTKAVLKWLEKHQQAIIEAYGLQDWDITVDVPENGDVKAEIHVDIKYQKAKIFIMAEEQDDVNDLFDSLCHELEHILQAPFDIYHETILAGLTGREKAMARELYDHVTELSRNLIGKAREGLLRTNYKSLINGP